MVSCFIYTNWNGTEKCGVNPPRHITLEQSHLSVNLFRRFC